MEYTIEKNINDRIGTIESDQYRYMSFNKDFIFDKKNQKTIYQGKFLDSKTGKYDGTFPDASWIDFLYLVEKLLTEEKEVIRKKNEEELEVFEKREAASRGAGWCDKCQSYCYGDCQS